MDHLSIPSIDFIKKASHNHQDLQWKKRYDTLVQEVCQIVRDIKDHIEQRSGHSWSFYNEHAETKDHPLTFKFSLGSTDPAGSKIEVIINPNGTSYLIGKHLNRWCSHAISAEELKEQISKAAYNRYFAQHSDLPHDIKTIIPRAQLSSRYLSEYLIHLTDMMLPVLSPSQKQAHAA